MSAVDPSADPAPEALEVRRTLRAMMIYPAPAKSDDFRGKLPHGEAFSVYEHIDGAGCRGQWGRVAVAGYVCLDGTEVTDQEPAVLPRLSGSRLVPFHYAKNRDNDNPAPVWRSRRAMKGGEDSIDALDPDHVYAFRWRKRARGGGYFSTGQHRTVAAKDVKALKPSEFTGRDVTANAVPADVVLAWTVRWPHTPLYQEPHPDAKPAGRLGYHEQFMVTDAPKRRKGVQFYPLADGTGWVASKDARRWLRTASVPDGVGVSETWLDIELNQQTLTVMRGTEPQFVTLVSSGTWKDPTPTGIFRIEGKMAVTDMRSRAGDDDSYHVEDVPWVMYFKGRYALHGVYWHGRFGQRASHGCVNLSPRDARQVYELTAPHTPPGWVMVFEHERDPGTMLRIRRGDKVPEDKRKPLG